LIVYVSLFKFCIVCGRLRIKRLLHEIGWIRLLLKWLLIGLLVRLLVGLLVRLLILLHVRLLNISLSHIVIGLEGELLRMLISVEQRMGLVLPSIIHILKIELLPLEIRQIEAGPLDILPA